MPEPSGPTRVVTFYSYKGGVGRTMALVNTAHVLALEGWRVLMVDFDLEAPGMTHFFAKQVRWRPRHVRKDAIDLLLDAKRSLEDADQRGQSPEYPCSLADYVVPLTLPKGGIEEAPKGIPYRNGRLDLIPATLEPRQLREASEEEPPLDYMERLGELDLAGLFREGGPGHRFGDHVRKHFVSARFKAPGDVLFTLRDPIKAAYDIVLIDSRTGLNEVAGFSIGTITDALVLCCGLSQQSIEGTRYFMKKTGLFNRSKAKPFLLAVGPVPPWLKPESDERLRTLRQALRLDQNTGQPLEDLLDHLSETEEGSLEIAYEFPELVEIPYHPLAAIRETVFVTELPREAITQAYVRLARRVQSRLQPGAAEAAQRHIYSRNLLHNPESLRDFCKFTASKLPELRLLHDQVPPIPLFPTAYGVTSLPKKRKEIRWEDLGRIPVAAAVLSLHSSSPAPFERAWAFLATLDNESYRRYLAYCLIYFQASTPYRLPRSSQNFLATPSGRDLPSDQRVLNDVCAYVAGLRLSSYHSDLQAEVKSRSFRAFLEKSLESLLIFNNPFHSPGRDWMSPRAASRVLRFVEKLAEGRLKEHSELFNYLIEDTFDDSIFTNIPLGFWPEPLAAATLAVNVGPDAVEEILEMLVRARFRYGYAWRVLLDWRYFDEVKQHPDFQAFLQQEDEAVASIEEAITRGEYLL